MKQLKFSGSIDLSDPNGIIYDDYIQTGEINIKVNSPISGGTAFISITANGDAINVPSDWTLISSDTIGTTDGDVNHIAVCFLKSGKIHYGNKLVAAA